MKKFLKCIIIILLSVILIVVGCIIANNIYEKKHFIDYLYEVDENKTAGIYLWLYNDIEKLQSVKEDKSLLKEKEEFIKWFNEYCGFSLPDYFIIPTVDEEHTWNQVSIDERFITIEYSFVMEKSDVMYILEHVRNDDSFVPWNYRSHYPVETPEEISRATYFGKRTDHQQFVSLNFHYNKNENVFIVTVWGQMERDPPPGTSWPELYWN